MRRCLVVLLLGTACALWAWAQSAEPARSPQQLQLRRVYTRLVLLDVVVKDGEGRPLTDLTRDDFRVFEDGVEQSLASFALVEPGRRPAGASPPLPPHVFTNRPDPRRPAGPLTILLLDGLNTRLADQAYAQQQALRYLDEHQGDAQPMAVLALNKQLRVLQDFTSDPRRVRAALENFRPQITTAGDSLADGADAFKLASNLVPAPPEGLGTASSEGSGAAAQEQAVVLNRLEQNLAEQRVESVDERVRITLGALRTIAQATRGYAERKNLVWVSSAFPLTLQAEDTAELPFLVVSTFGPALQDKRANDQMALSRVYLDEIRQVGGLLTEAQIAVYPVDARGLVNTAVLQASNSGRDAFGLTPAVYQDGRDRRLPVSSHQSMRQLAEDTGGRAFFNANDLASAIGESIADGSTYYTLSYYPRNKDWDGRFRRLEVQVNRRGAQVAHRRGYFAFDLRERWRQRPRARDEEFAAALLSPLDATGLTFRVRAVPPAPGPKARVPLDVWVDVNTLDWEPEPAGGLRSNLDFLAVAFSAEGKPVGSVSHTVDIRVRSGGLRELEEGIAHRLELELEPGRYLVRVLVRDNHTGRLGTLTLPLQLEKP